MALNVELLRSSFAEVVPIADKVADKFYENLFKDFPQVKSLFVSARMEVQKKALINSLVMIIDNLDDSDKLANYLHAMGARHFDYGTRVEHYPAVGATLIKTFSHLLGTKWNKELEKVWSEAYQAISSLMIEGHKSVVPEIEDIKLKAKKISEELLMEMLDEQLSGDFLDLVRARVRNILLSTLKEESAKILKKDE